MAEILGTAQTNGEAVSSASASAGNADGDAKEVKGAEEASGNTEESDAGSDAQFTDSDGADSSGSGKDADGGSAAEGKDKSESNGRNTQRDAEFARRRREAERKRELDEARQAARREAIIETLGGKNPYTGEDVTDADDVEEYLLMREIEKKGGDPIADYHKAAKEKSRNAAKERSEEQNQQEWFRRDREAFAAKHPDVDIGELCADEQFKLFADGRVGRVPLSDIYEGYRQFLSEFDKKSKRIAAQTVANKRSSPGSLSGKGTPGQTVYTREQVKKMSQKEVSEHYDDIRRSMGGWTS